MCKRVTLLEGPPFAGELIAIKNNFRTVKFEDIFRSEKLENRMTYHYSHPVIPVPFNYASAAARPPFPPEPSSAGQRGSSPPTTSVWRGRVFRNKNGERIDQPLEYSRLDYEKVKPLRLCNNFYLLGTCTWGDKCEHDHKMRLSDREKAALRALARQRPCQSGLHCADSDCLYGHNCPWGNNCDQSRCRFPDDRHGIDMKIVPYFG